MYRVRCKLYYVYDELRDNKDQRILTMMNFSFFVSEWCDPWETLGSDTESVETTESLVMVWTLSYTLVIEFTYIKNLHTTYLLSSMEIATFVRQYLILLFFITFLKI